MLASLPMYDRPALRAHTHRFWAALRDRARAEGITSPDRLSRPDNLKAHWLAPNLLFSQTCGLPLTTFLKDRVRVIATPVYRVPGCGTDGTYSSVIIARRGSAQNLSDLAQQRVAVNDCHSQSGLNVLRFMLRGQASPYFSETILTGSHENSALAVLEDKADCAAIDCVTWTLMADEQDLAGLEVIVQSPPAPGLPYITSLQTDARTLRHLRAALKSICTAPEMADTCRALKLVGIRLLPETAYSVISDMRAAVSEHNPIPL